MNHNISVNSETVRTVLQRAYCQCCGQELTKTGRVFYSSPLQYEYKCDNENCSSYNVVFNSTECYPRIRFIDENGNDIEE